MIVVDVNVVVYLLTDGSERELAKALYENDPDWRLPRLWRHEFHNVVARLTRNGNLDPEFTIPLWRNGIEMFGTGESDPDFERAIDLALEHEISGYDAQYVALAEELGVHLWTADRELLRKFPGLCCNLHGA